MSKVLDKFWVWYEKHYTLNVAFSSVLFSWQVIHLVWLFSDVIFARLFGFSIWYPVGIWQKIIIVVDYTEIPALVSTGLIYVDQLRKGYDFKSALFLVLLWSQVFHIFWITDAFVVDVFTGGGQFVYIPPALAWVAILIDYLEVPVMIETFKKFFDAIGKKDAGKVAKAFVK